MMHFAGYAVTVHGQIYECSVNANNGRMIAERDELKTRSLAVAERLRAMLQVNEYFAK